jgi:hypothetical protein
MNVLRASTDAPHKPTHDLVQVLAVATCVLFTGGETSPRFSLAEE